MFPRTTFSKTFIEWALQKSLNNATSNPLPKSFLYLRIHRDHSRNHSKHRSARNAQYPWFRMKRPGNQSQTHLVELLEQIPEGYGWGSNGHTRVPELPQK